MTEEQVAATEETPEVEEVEAEEEATASEEESSTEEQAEEVEAPEQPPKKGRDAESRIAELTWKSKTAQEQAEYWRDMYERSRNPQPEQQKVEEPELNLPEAPIPPDRFDYDDDDAYRQALAGFQRKNAEYLNQVVEAREQAANAKRQESQKQQVYNERQATLAQKIQAGVEKYHDFEPVAFSSSVPYSQTMIEGLVDAENSADIAYYLGKNPQEAASISQMTPMQQLLAIGKLDLKVAAQATKKTTKAPPPSQPVHSGGSSSAISDPDRLPIEEWRRLREEGKI